MNVAAAAGQVPFHALQQVQSAPPSDGADAEAFRAAANADLADIAASSVGEPLPSPSTDAIFSIQASLGLVAASAGRSGASSLSS